MSSLVPDRNVAFHLAARLTRLREARGLSRADVADGAGVGKAEIYRFETANATLRAADLPGIADVLHVPPSALFEGLPHDAPAPAGAPPDATTLDLVRSFLAVRDRAVRSKLVAVARRAATAK